MAASCWQHEITRFNVVAYAIGGDDAAERVPNTSGAQGSQRSQSGPSGPTVGWEHAHGEWRLEHAPTITPEEDQRRKEIALSKLLGLARTNAQANRSKYAHAKVEDAAAADFAEQLDRVNGRTDGED